MNKLRCAILALCSIVLVGCGDITGSTGVKGRVSYSLYTHYEIDEWDLTAVSMVTGHPQLIRTEMTNKGSDQLRGPASDIVHTIEPAEGVTVINEFDEPLADLLLTVEEPGDYTIKSEINGDIFDYLEVRFDAPDELELINWVREPSVDDFEQLEAEVIPVTEGSQVTFLPIPTVAGDRLAGDISVELSADPETSVVRGENIWGVYEQSVTSSDQPVSLYFVEPGTVTITILDGPNGVERSQVFAVEGI